MSAHDPAPAAAVTLLLLVWCPRNRGGGELLDSVGFTGSARVKEELGVLESRSYWSTELLELQ